MLDGVDGRTPQARRYRDLCAAFAADLGGFETLSEAQKQLVRRSAALSAVCEAAEAKLAAGEAVDMPGLNSTINTLRRLLGDLGLERRARDVTPDPLSYARAKAAEGR